MVTHRMTSQGAETLSVLLHSGGIRITNYELTLLVVQERNRSNSHQLPIEEIDIRCGRVSYESTRVVEYWMLCEMHGA